MSHSPGETCHVGLTTFLLARIAEDEAVASRADGSVWELCQHEVMGAFEGGRLVHVRASRVLAECEAKRRIVERYERLMNESKDMPSAEAQIWRGLAGETRLAMFDLARPYADHADYREEWRP